MLSTLLQKLIITILTSTICTAPVVDFGSVSPVGGGRYQLSGSGITSTATSITVKSLKYPVSDLEITMEHFGSSIGYGTIEPGSSSKIEFISFTGITQNSGGSATLTGVSRGLAPYSPYNASTTYAQAHPGGSRVIFSNSPAFYDHYASELNDELIQGDWTYSSTSTPQYNQAPTFTSQSFEFATVDFVEDTANQGAATSTQQAGGIAELAERHEANTTTGESGYNLVLPASIATTTREVATSSVIMSDVLGYISQTFFNFNTLWSFGSTTHSASSTFAGDVYIGANATTSGTFEVEETLNADGALNVAGVSTFTGVIDANAANNTMASTTFEGNSVFVQPPFTEADPTNNDQLARKSYVDDQMIQVESGNSSRGANVSAGYEWIDLTATFQPKVIRITAYREGGATNQVYVSHGTWDESNGQSSMRVRLEGGIASANSATDIISLCGQAGSDCDTNFNAILVNTTGTDGFSLNWDATPNDGDTLYFFWEAYR